MKSMGVGRPDSIDERQDGVDLVLTRRWFDGWAFVITAFAAAWIGFLVFWYSQITDESPAIMIWFPLLHVGVGVFLAYYTLAKWLNRTTVRVGQGVLRTSTRPLPMEPDRSIPSGSIKQLYAKENTSYSRHGRNTSYSLHAILTDGRNLKLIGGLENQEQALYLEERIERFLGIEDAAVKGELGK